MSNILKGILNEVNPHNYDSDWDYQDAVARSGKSRSSYRSQEDDTSDADIEYSKKMYQLSQKQKRDADHDRLASGTNEDDNNQTRMRMNDYYDLAEALQEKLRQAIQMGDNELVHELSKKRADLDAHVKKYGLIPESQLDEISNEKLSQYKTAAAADASKADSEGDYKRGDKRFSGIVKATKKQFANDTKKSGIGQGISEESNRFNSKQEVINHFVKNGKSAAAGAAAWERGYRGSSNKPVELKKPPQRSYHDDLDDKRYSNTFENLGDQLKSQSLEALQQIKQQIEQKRADELAQWEQDFRNNVAGKMRSQPIRSPEATPVAQPGEKHSVLKARLAQLNNAIQKQELLDKLIDKIDRKGLLTPAMQNDADTRMHVKYGAKDNYQSLNKKLDNSISMLQDRLYIRKKSGLKEAPKRIDYDSDTYDNTRMGREYGKANLFVDPGSNEFKKEIHPGDPEGERGRPRNLKGISKRLPADAFGRTSGVVPDSARPKSKEDPFKGVDEADMNRRGFLGQAGKAAGAGALAAAGLGGASNAQAFKGTLPAPRISEDEAEAQIKELRSKAYKELASMMWNVWPKILDTTFGANTPQDKPATPDEIGKMLGYRLAEYADDYRQKVRAIKIAAGVRDPQSLNKTTAAIYVNEQEMDEGWSQKYKSSINCSHPKGFSQKAHCAGKKKHNESIDNVMEMTCPDCGMCETHVDHAKLDEACWKGYHKEGNKKMFGKTYPNCVKNTNEEQLDEKCWDTHKQVGMKNKGGRMVPNCVPKESVEEQHSHSESCPHCGGEMVSEELMNEKKDACYYKVKSRYKVWPSAYASGALVKCRNKGASNWGNGGKKNESSILEGIEQADESLHDWFNKEKWVRMDTKGKIKGPCAREPGEGKPKCLPQSKAHSLGKKGRASAAQRKRREDPNPERSGKAINVDTKKKD
jgi:hypothetical protein